MFIAEDYPCIRLVQSFDELASASFADGVNALCWQRKLEGDFAEVARHFAAAEGITSLDESLLLGLPLSPGGMTAAHVMLADLQRLRSMDLAPELNCINGYKVDDDGSPVPRDVLSWHADSATAPADTWLCTYCGPSSEGLRNAEAIPHASIPATRAALLKLHGGPDDESFLEFLADHCYDLHYAELPGAKPYTFGAGHLWRVAAQFPGSPVPPCIHRAPRTQPRELRLLLIS